MGFAVESKIGENNSWHARLFLIMKFRLEIKKILWRAQNFLNEENLVVGDDFYKKLYDKLIKRVDKDDVIKINELSSSLSPDENLHILGVSDDLNKIIEHTNELINHYKGVLSAEVLSVLKTNLKNLYKSLYDTINSDEKSIKNIKNISDTHLKKDNDAQTISNTVFSYYSHLFSSVESKTKIENFYKDDGELDKIVPFDQNYWTNRVQELSSLIAPTSPFYLMLGNLVRIFPLFCVAEGGLESDGTFAVILKNLPSWGLEHFNKELKNWGDKQKVIDLLTEFSTAVNNFNPDNYQLILNNISPDSLKYFEKNLKDVKKFTDLKYPLKELKEDLTLLEKELNLLKTALERGSGLELFRIVKIIVNLLGGILKTQGKSKILMFSSLIQLEKTNFIAHIEKNALLKPEVLTTFEENYEKFANLFIYDNSLLVNIQNYTLITTDIFDNVAEYEKVKRKELNSITIQMNINTAIINFNENYAKDLDFSDIQDKFKETYEKYEELRKNLEESEILKTNKNKTISNLQKLTEETQTAKDVVDNIEDFNIKLFSKADVSDYKLGDYNFPQSECLVMNILNNYKYNYYRTREFIEFLKLNKDKERKEEIDNEREENDAELTDYKNKEKNYKEILRYAEIIKKYGNEFFIKEFEKSFEDVKSYADFENKKTGEKYGEFMHATNKYYQHLKELVPNLKIIHEKTKKIEE